MPMDRCLIFKCFILFYVRAGTWYKVYIKSAVGRATNPRLKTRFSSPDAVQRRKFHFKTGLVGDECHLEPRFFEIFVDECPSDSDE